MTEAVRVPDALVVSSELLEADDDNEGVAVDDEVAVR